MNKRVLVLNLDHSPISVCTVQRAFLLIYLDKAQLLTEAKGFVLRSVNMVFPMPAVIKLNKYVRIPYMGVELNRQNIFKRDGFECQYCGNTKSLTLDHVFPRSKGGKSSWTNLVTACKRCNTQKGDFTPEEAGMKLIGNPYRPSYIMFLRDFSGFVQREWEPFLSTMAS